MSAHNDQKTGKLDWPLTNPGMLGGDISEAQEALYKAYLEPLYAFLRQVKRDSPENAKDIVQGFFLYFFQHDGLSKVDFAKGRFRTFMIRCVSNYRANWLAKVPPTDPLETHIILKETGRDPFEDAVIEEDTQIARRLVISAMNAITEDWEASGVGLLLKDLTPFLARKGKDGDYTEIAARHKIDEETLRVKVHRLRQEWRKHLRRGLRQFIQLDSTESVDDKTLDGLLVYYVGLFGTGAAGAIASDVATTDS